jgi:hypothetical protein
MFKKNVGNTERLIRFLVGVALVALVFVGPQTPFGWIGLVLIFTAVVGWCPPYAILGINTCKMKKD